MGGEKASEKAARLCSFPKAVMCPVFICSLVLWFLSAGTLNAEVTQTPGHLVTGKGQKAEMHCVPIKGHSYVFWYQQIPAKELKFLISFQNGVIFDKTGMPEKRFSAVCPQNSPCSLEIKPTELQDLAVYFCASSESTVDTQTLQSARSPATGSPKMGQRRVLRRDPISGHRLAYWCPQNQRQGMEFLISFQNENTAAELGCPRNGSQPKDLMEHLPPEDPSRGAGGLSCDLRAGCLGTVQLSSSLQCANSPAPLLSPEL